MDNSGHIKISRRTFRPLVEGGDPLWNEAREFSRWEAWVYMIRSAAWRQSVYKDKHGETALERGETPPMAIRYLQAAWKWKSEKRVHSFIRQLEEWKRIEVGQRKRQGNTYLIVNYDLYQGSGNAEETPEETLGKQSRSSKAPKQKTSRERGSKRAPDSFEPDDTHRFLAKELGVDFAYELGKFRDHEYAKPLTDWPAAFRNWLKRSAEFQGTKKPKKQNGPYNWWNAPYAGEDAA